MRRTIQRNSPLMDEFDDELEVDLPDEDEEDLIEEPEEVAFNPKGEYTKAELEEWANQLLLVDVNRELCPQCKELNKQNPRKYPDETPYGTETGHVEAMAQIAKNGDAIVDENGDQLYIDYPEFRCEAGHKWYLGEGPRRDIKGPNPILFKSHLDNRIRREIQNEAGVADPAFTKGRFGQPGMYNRVNPDGGRKQNTLEQRKRNGASFFGSSSPSEAWGWRLQERNEEGIPAEPAKITTRIATKEELDAIPRGKRALSGEDKRDRSELSMPR
jgi:hypothetical protein